MSTVLINFLVFGSFGDTKTEKSGVSNSSFDMLETSTPVEPEKPVAPGITIANQMVDLFGSPQSEPEKTNQAKSQPIKTDLFGGPMASADALSKPSIEKPDLPVNPPVTSSKLGDGKPTGSMVSQDLASSNELKQSNSLRIQNQKKPPTQKTIFLNLRKFYRRQNQL